MTVLTKKQIKGLRKMAQTTKGTVQVGKGGVTDGTLINLNEALLAHELVKVTVLKNSTDAIGDIAEALADASEAVLVQVIGRQIVLYKRNPDKPLIQLADL